MRIRVSVPLALNRCVVHHLNQGFSTGGKFTPWGYIVPILGVNLMMLKLQNFFFSTALKKTTGDKFYVSVGGWGCWLL